MNVAALSIFFQENTPFPYPAADPPSRTLKGGPQSLSFAHNHTYINNKLHPTTLSLPLIPSHQKKTNTRLSLKPNNTRNSLKHLLRILSPILIFLLQVIIFPITEMIIQFPESRWACRAMDIVIPNLVNFQNSTKKE